MTVWETAAALVMMAAGSIYGTKKKAWGRRALFFKVLATMSGVLLSLQSALLTPELWRWLLTAGLLFCVAADVLLEIQLLAGVSFFGAAHLCFLGASFCLGGWKLPAAGMALILYGIFFLSFRRYLPKLGNLLVPGLIYPALLCLMAGTAVLASCGEAGQAPATFGAGGLLFVASDYLLAERVLGKSRKGQNMAVLILYYGAVYLIALG